MKLQCRSILIRFLHAYETYIWPKLALLAVLRLQAFRYLPFTVPVSSHSKEHQPFFILAGLKLYPDIVLVVLLTAMGMVSLVWRIGMLCDDSSGP